MSVWNRPMFAGARPPNSARAELERLRVGMAEGGVPVDAIDDMLGRSGYVPGPLDPASDSAPRAPARQTASEAFAGFPSRRELPPADREPLTIEVDLSQIPQTEPAAEPATFDPRLQPFGMDRAEMADFLRDRYTARESLYDELLGDPDRRRAQARSEIFFEIAQRALQFAGGVGPDGQPMRGSMFAQAAQSFAPVFGSLAERSRELTDQERALRASRLEAAETDLAREQGLRAEITGAQVRSLMEGMGAGAPPQPLTFEALLPAQEEIDEHLPNLPDIRRAYDPGAPFRNFMNTAGAIIGWQYSPDTNEAVVATQFINNRLLGSLAQSLQQSGRPSNFTLELSRDLLQEPAQFRTSVASAQNAFIEIQNAIEADLADEVRKYNTALAFEQQRSAMDAFNAMQALRVSHMEVSAVLDSLGGRRTPAGGQRDFGDLADMVE